MPILSLAALTILDAGPFGLVRAAHAAGFSHAGLRLQPLLATDEAVAGDRAREDELEHLLRQTGVKPLEIGVFPIKPGFDVDEYGPALSFSHRIGARFITCPVEDADPGRRLPAFGRLCDLAISCGLEALVEFNPYSGCRTLAEADAMVVASGRENARLLIDALHLSRSGGGPDDLKRIPPERVALVHLCDASPPPTDARSVEELRQESRNARLYPGEGSLWLEQLLQALPPGTPLSIEAPSAAHRHLPAEERAKAAMAATSRLLDRLSSA